jgi:glycosyltransferase involved in cell wall biosynthesis
MGTYPPRACGIATFTRDLRQAVGAAWAGALPVVALDRGTDSDPTTYPPEVELCVRPPGVPVEAIGRMVRRHDVGVVSVQHEFGIFGGPAGSDVLRLVDTVGVPVVTTLHTVPVAPDTTQAGVLRALGDMSARIVVMSERGRRLAIEGYGMVPERVHVIPHGVPHVPFVSTEGPKAALGLAGEAVILSYGLISPNKGLHTAVAAMAAVLGCIPEARLVIAGATHPEVRRLHGEAYRQSLHELARDMGVAHRVTFVDRYLTASELQAWLLAADVFVTPYGDSAQVTSGTLAYALASGRAIVSTPYEHARELLADGRGSLVAFDDPAALGDAIVRLLADDEARLVTRRRAWDHGRRMAWPEVGRAYAALSTDVLAGEPSVTSP